MGYKSLLSKFIDGVPCQLRLDWNDLDNPCTTWVSFDTREPFSEEADSFTGMVYPQEEWRLRFTAHLTREVSVGIVRWFGQQLRDTSVLYVVAYVHVMSPPLLTCLPSLPRSMLRSCKDPATVAEDMSEADRAWISVREAVCAMQRQNTLKSQFKHLVI